MNNLFKDIYIKVIVTIIAGAVVWAVVKLEDMNMWDHEADPIISIQKENTRA